MSETPIQKEIMLYVSKLGHRLFRVNTGMGWAGKSTHFSDPMKVQVYPGDVLIRKARPLHAGMTEGGSDLIGWTADGHFLAIETKTPDGKTDKERLEKQQNFIAQINKCGGIGFIATSVEDVKKILPC